MTRRARLAPLRRALVSAGPLLVLGAAAARPDFPPPAHTGGFGEPTCAECHSGSPVNAPGTGLSLGGLPPRWRPGASYRIAVQLSHEDLARGGFELSARYAATGAQAGTLAPGDSTRTAVTRDSVTGILYAHHTREGTRAIPVGRWVVVWRTPPAGGGVVVLHAAAVASNDDDSNLGDYVVTAADTVPRRP